MDQELENELKEKAKQKEEVKKPEVPVEKPVVKPVEKSVEKPVEPEVKDVVKVEKDEKVEKKKKKKHRKHSKHHSKEPLKVKETANSTLYQYNNQMKNEPIKKDELVTFSNIEAQKLTSLSNRAEVETKKSDEEPKQVVFTVETKN